MYKASILRIKKSKNIHLMLKYLFICFLRSILNNNNFVLVLILKILKNTKIILNIVY